MTWHEDHAHRPQDRQLLRRILGEDALAGLAIAEGDTLFVVRTPDGIRLTAYDPDFADALEAGRDYMRRHRNALRELAR